MGYNGGCFFSSSCSDFWVVGAGLCLHLVLAGLCMHFQVFRSHQTLENDFTENILIFSM